MSFTFSPLKIGGGGFTTGIDITPDGQSLTCRIDVSNCYRYNFSTSLWENLCTGAKVGAPTFAVTAIGGGIEVVSAPSNSAIIYMWMADGNLYRSTNSGGVFTKLTGFGNHDPSQSNAGSKRLNGKKMAVDPANPDILYVGTIDNGVMISTNATTTASFGSPTGITAAGSKGYALAFDARVSQRTAGSSNILYVHSDTNGVFSMSAPGGAFSHMAGSPAAIDHIVVSPNGLIWAAYDDQDGGAANPFAYKCVSGAWTSYTSATLGLNPHSILVDTTRSGGAGAERIIIGGDGGKLNISLDSGSTWGGVLTFTRTATDVPWLAEANEFFMSNGDMIYDATRDLIRFAEGVGVWTAPGGTSSGPFVWTSATAGIESLQFNGVVSSAAATSAPNMYLWDRGVFHTSDPSTYSAHQTSTSISSIIAGWDLEWASSDGSTLVSLNTWAGASSQSTVGGNSGLDVSGTSTDNGLTWLPFPMTTQGVTAAITATGGAAGQEIITCSTTFPAWFGVGMVVKNNTHGGTTVGYVQAGQTDLLAQNLVLDRNITGVGVSNGDSLTVGFPGSPQVKAFATTTASASGAVLHFTGIPANLIQPFNQVYNLSNPNSLASAIYVQSISGSDVTLSANINSAIALGDVIQFVNCDMGGSIAAASPTNFVMVPSDDSPFPYYTTDGGATWTAIDLGLPRPMAATFVSGSTTVTVADTSSLLTGSGATLKDGTNSGATFIPGNTFISSITDATHFVMSSAALASGTNLIRPRTGWGANHTSDNKAVCADRVTPDTFYMYNDLTGKVYKTSNKGVGWTAQNSTPLSVRYLVDAGIKSVPGNAGHLFTGDSSFLRSTDGGATWNAVPNISELCVYAFGKPIATYPTVWIWAAVSGDFSLWMSSDNCVSWTKVIGATDVTPFGTRDNIVALDGDKNIAGKVYGTFNFSGAFFGALDVAASNNIVGFSVVHGRGGRHVKMTGY